MAGVGVISSLAVFLFLMFAGFSAAREERSLRSASWAKVADHKYNYLALLNVSGTAECSGSIPSKWTVLTFCALAIADGKTKAYAGMLAVANAVPGKPDVQERDVMKVAADDTFKDLKICTLNKIWELDDNVGSISVRGSTVKECDVLGFGTVSGEKDVVARLSKVTVDSNNCESIIDGQFGSKVATATESTEKLEKLDLGGPVVCDGVQHGINMKYNAAATDGAKCNLYIALAKYSKWIEAQEQAAEEAGAAGGTGGNGTSPSSGYSIHSYLNKYSNWKVLGFLVPTIVTFLQY